MAVVGIVLGIGFVFVVVGLLMTRSSDGDAHEKAEKYHPRGLDSGPMYYSNTSANDFQMYSIDENMETPNSFMDDNRPQLHRVSMESSILEEEEEQEEVQEERFTYQPSQFLSSVVTVVEENSEINDDQTEYYDEEDLSLHYDSADFETVISDGQMLSEMSYITELSDETEYDSTLTTISSTSSDSSYRDSSLWASDAAHYRDSFRTSDATSYAPDEHDGYCL